MQIASMVPVSAKGLSTRLLITNKRVEIQDVAAALNIIREESKFVRKLIPPVLTALVALFPLYHIPTLDSFAQAADIQRGSILFRRACIGCHDAGGNIIQPGATLFSSDLQKNGVDTTEGIYQVTYYGKGRMPGFGEKCSPRGQCTFGPRLQEEEIKLLAEYVKHQADQGWQNIETNSED